ncbi:lipoprotein [Spiroplasma endosymbiont of Panorpa germanica]|uniref:lipoprotein n=1 Tax=Spiroplasma endosymbiont of Panorpa germanica TaxID=3066314 RepID=UPI0030CB376C
MKKLLAMFGALSLTVTPVLTVTACQTKVEGRGKTQLSDAVKTLDLGDLEVKHTYAPPELYSIFIGIKKLNPDLEPEKEGYTKRFLSIQDLKFKPNVDSTTKSATLIAEPGAHSFTGEIKVTYNLVPYKSEKLDIQKLIVNKELGRFGAGFDKAPRIHELWEKIREKNPTTIGNLGFQYFFVDTREGVINNNQQSTIIALDANLAVGEVVVKYETYHTHNSYGDYAHH